MYNPYKEGSSITPGHSDIHSSFRSEMIGALAVLQQLKDICKTNNISEGHLTLHSDNKTILKVVQHWIQSKVSPRKKNSDVISACLKLRDELPIRITCQYVPAHQDDHCRIEDLSPIAQLNVHVDKQAKLLAEKVILGFVDRVTDMDHPASLPTCRYKGKQIQHCVFEQLYNEITSAAMSKYWVDKNRLSKTTQDLIDMPSMASAHKSMSCTTRRFSAKWSCECLATGKNMVRWKEHHKGNCPYCLEEMEDTRHILLCQHIDALNIWNEAMEEWIKKLRKLDTCSYLIRALKLELTSWKTGTAPPAINMLPSGLQRAIKEQRLIGWKQFLEGLHSKLWKTYMTTYYLNKKSQRKGSTWASKLIHNNWKLITALWEGRNKQLHQTERINDLEGMPLVREAIETEWRIGLGRLPASQFSQYFSLPLDKLLERSHDHLKTWLSTIRQGRILLDPSNLCHDEFEEMSSLQKWLDISYVVSDDEGIPMLKEAIRAEWNIGKGLLPITFNSLFQGSLRQLLQRNVQKMKLWLRTVRNGRIKFDNGNLLLDEFSSPGALQQWIQQ